MKIRITKKDFRTWVKRLPKNKTFNYSDNFNCVIGTFLRQVHNVHACVGSDNYDAFSKNHLKIYSVNNPLPNWLYQPLLSFDKQDNPLNRIITKNHLLSI